jgi:ABC-type multidrug transport system fused ATPase/permease subunit
MSSIKKFFYLLTAREKKQYIFITVFLFFNTFIEMFSLSLIIPLFNIIFLNEYPNYNFLLEFGIEGNIFSENKILIIFLVFLVFAIKNIFLILYNYFTGFFFSKSNIKISNELVSGFLNQNYNFFLKKKSNSILKKSFEDVKNLRIFLVSFQIFATELIFCAALAIFLLIINFKIFLYFLVTFSIIFFAYFKLIKNRIVNWSKTASNSIEDSQSLLSEGIEGIKDIIIYILKDNFIDKIKILFKTYNISVFKLDFINNIARFWIETVVVFVLTSSLVFIIYFGYSAQEFLPVFTLFAVAVFRIIPSMNRLIASYQNLRYYKLSLGIIYDHLHEFRNQNLKDFQKEKIFEKLIVFNNVSYFYENSKIILRDVNLEIRKGDKICIRGENGSGKSTVLNLVAGLLIPSTGKIVIDSYTEIQNIKNWFENISYVQQNIFLFDDSIVNNITLNSGYNKNKFDNIIYLLSLEKIFCNFKAGVNSVVGKNGSKLSGGQKQVLAVARALYKDSEIILFDEPTSAMDLNYMAIFKNFLLNSSNKTILVVTHDELLNDHYFDKVYQIKKQKLELTYVKK